MSPTGATRAPGLVDVTRPTQTVPDAAAWIGVSERSLRRAVEPGRELEHLAVRVGSRVLIKTDALLALVGR
jgi:hypothetical protein